MVWKWVKGKNGNPTKPPFRADAPRRHASSTDPSTWSDLATAMRAYIREECDGLGFALVGSDVGAFDLDDCRDAATGALHPWALDKIERSRSYAEITPSSTGARIIGLAKGEPIHRKFNVPNANGVSVELYRKAERYITITGQQIGAAASMAGIDALLDQTLIDLDGCEVKSPQPKEKQRRDLDKLIKEGCGLDFGRDRSRAVWWVINTLLKRGRSADDVIATLLDRANGISAHIYDQPRPEDYARRQVAKAQAAGAAGPGDDDAELKRLASLPIIDYERARADAAKRLGVRAPMLDRLIAMKRAEFNLDRDSGKQGHALDLPSPEPWPEPVDGAKLLDDMTAAIKRHVVLSEHEARGAALWCVHTYLVDCFLISPRLAIRSATHRCGKSTLVDIVSYLALRTLPSANVTAASVFRVVEACRPTLLIDEADTFLPEADELRGVINSGHRRGGSVVRTVGDDHEPRKFSTYAACAIALIGKLPATLHDRSAPVVDLKRRLMSEKVERFRLDRTAHLDELARKTARWAADHADEIRDADPELPPALFNRDADNWSPLLAIAEAAGGKWPERAREAAAICCAAPGVEDASQLELLLGDIRDVFAANQADESTSADEITSAALVRQLIDIEGRPWAEMGKSQKPLTQNKLARMLKPLGVGPEEIGPTASRLRGYKRGRFADAFDRYLSPEEGSQSVHPSRTQQNQATPRIFKPSSGSGLDACENLGNPSNSSQLDGWTVAKGGDGENAHVRRVITSADDAVAATSSAGGALNLWPDGAGFDPDLRGVADPVISAALREAIRANYDAILAILRREAGLT
jgi:putative DNA primase/helicase